MAKRGGRLRRGLLPPLVSGNQPLQCQVTITARFPARKPTGQPWDGDASAPDPFGKMVVGVTAFGLSKRLNTFVASWTFGVLLSRSSRTVVQADILDSDLLSHDRLVAGRRTLNVGENCSGQTSIGPYVSVVVSGPRRAAKSPPAPGAEGLKTVKTFAVAARVGLVKMGLVKWKINNPSGVQQSLTLETQIPGLTGVITDTAAIKVGASVLWQLISFRTDALTRITQMRPMAMSFAVKDAAGRGIWTHTGSVVVQPIQTMWWGPYGLFRDLVAAWVTPHAPVVLRWIAKHRRRFHNMGTASNFKEQWKTIKAVYDALRFDRMTYLNSAVTFAPNHAQRIRLPSDSLRSGQMNCIDGALVYASIYENMGLKPVVVLGPGHAFVAVRVGARLTDLVPIETTMTYSATFENAYARARISLSNWAARGVLTIVDIEDARRRGIVPFADAAR